jgi:beta-lactamase class D
MFRLSLGTAAVLLLSACGSATPAAKAPSGPTPLVAGAESSPAAPTPAAAPGAASEVPGVVWAPELGKELEAEHVTGTVALFDSKDGVVRCSDVKLCAEAVSPASTFKIPHSMIALETGLVDDPDTVLPWDKQHYSNDAWNQDLKFRDAFRLSCLPCYRAIARKVGEAGEREWVTKLGYGNRDTSGGVDRFWVWGGLRISALEQIAFLRRFDGDQLPISSRTADIVRDIMTIDVTESYVLRGKTGSEMPPDEPRELSWFVGWLELGERRVFFATLLTGHAPNVDPLPARRAVTERILRSKGLM